MMSRSSGNAWLIPLRVTSTSVISPWWVTTMSDGYGEPGLVSGMVMEPVLNGA
jgi:hypothetical protein